MHTRPESRWSRWAEIWLIPMIILGFAITLTSFGCWVIHQDNVDSLRRAHATYAVWTKLHPETSLSYEDWVVAYRAGLLTPRR